MLALHYFRDDSACQAALAQAVAVHTALYQVPDFLLECAVLWLARARRCGSKIKVTIPGD